MSYDAAEARQEMVNTVAEAAEALGRALSALGEAYELLDERSADTLEVELFGPVQKASGVAQRTASSFAARIGLDMPVLDTAIRGHPSQGATGFVQTAVDEVAEAELILVTLQDSLRPVEVGDDGLRAGLSEVRRTLAEVPARAKRFSSLLGR